MYTGQRHQPPAEAFAVVGSKFLAVGSFNHVYDSLPSTSVDVHTVDLLGGFVTPGLIDTHLHLISGGLSLTRLDLRHVTSKVDFIHAVHAAVQTASPGAWIQGANWDESKWGGEVPSAEWINQIAPENPVFLTRMDAHQAVVNDVAMKQANLTLDTPDPPGGVIIRDPVTKQPTGLLSDAAMLLVSSAIPPKTVEQRQAGFHAAQDHLLSLGITSVHDMGRIAFLEGEDAAWDDLEEVYLPAADDGSLKIKVNVFFPLPTWRRLAERVKHIGTRHPGGKLLWGGVKEFYDGSLGSRTALMHEPYIGQALKKSGGDGDGGKSNGSGSGEIVIEEEEEQLVGTRTVDKAVFQRQIHGAHAAGLQIAVHAIGDRAVDEVLDAYAALEGKKQGEDQGKDLLEGINDDNSIRQRRHRIEHAQHTKNSALVREKMDRLGVVITPNPLHLLADQNILESRLGKERVDRGSYAFKTLCSTSDSSISSTEKEKKENTSSDKENNEETEGQGGGSPDSDNVRCAFASDWPVVELNPALTLRAASVQSRTESVSPEEAFLGMTSNAAYIGHREKEVGRIAPGLFADFVIFNSDIMDSTLGGADIVRQTFVDGVCVYGCDGEEENEEGMGGGGDGGIGDVKDEL